MAKKKTRVTLPGSLSDLVRDLQNGGNGNITGKNPQNDEQQEEKQEEQQEEQHNEQQNSNRDKEVARPQFEPGTDNVAEQQIEDRHGVNNNGQQGRVEDTNRPIGNAGEATRNYSPGRPVKQNTMKEYHIVKDDTKDSWDLFLDMAKQYKDGGGKLATIYIDGTLKNILDRMKYVGEEKLPTAAILSSIVARFIYDHEDDIRKALFSGNLF